MKDKPVCFICDSEKRVVVHYVDWNPRNDRPSNRIFACKKCIKLLSKNGIIDLAMVRDLRRKFNFKNKGTQMELFQK